MMSDSNGYIGFRLRQPEVLRQRTARQLWQTLAVAFPGVFTDVRPRRGEAEEDNITQTSDVLAASGPSIMSLLETPVVNSLVAFVGQAVQGTSVVTMADFDSNSDSPSKQNFELRFLADCEESLSHYWELCLNIRSDDDSIEENSKACLVNGENQPLTGVELVVFSGPSRKVTWKKDVTGPLVFDQSDLKAIYMQSPAVRFPDGSLQSGKLASVSPVS